MPLDLTLAAVEDDIADAWERHCGDLDFVTVYRGSILDLACDALVSPANSFGFMDGGIDMAYSKHFGWHVQARLQEAIRTRHHGELLVGRAEIVETGDPVLPYLIAAPTMRVPMLLRDTVNPYLAARAVLLFVNHGAFPDGMPVREKVRSVAFPGLGTGVGGVSADTCARQVRAAIDSVLLGIDSLPSAWWEAEKQHIDLIGGASRSLQHG